MFLWYFSKPERAPFCVSMLSTVRNLCRSRCRFDFQMVLCQQVSTLCSCLLIFCNSWFVTAISTSMGDCWINTGAHLDNVSDDWALTTEEYRATAGVVWPLGFYGDEAAIGLINAPTNKILGLYMNIVVFRPTSTRMGRYLLFSIESDKVVSPEETIFPVVDVITASFNKLTEQGIGHIRFLLSEIRGDQVFFRYLFQHRSWWKHTEVCFRCKADSKCGSLNYCIYDSPDGWRTTLRSTAEFLVDQLPQNRPEWSLDELISDVFWCLFGGFCCVVNSVDMENSSVCPSATAINCRPIGWYSFLPHFFA